MQTAAQENVCGNGTLPEDIICQNCESQIQGSDNAVDINCHQSQLIPPQDATLIVIKLVTCSSTNPHGCDGIEPSSFTIRVTGNNPSPSTFPGSGPPGTTVAIGHGSYSVTDDPFPGNSPVFSSDCSGTIAPGQTKTCTISNFVLK